MSDNSTASSSFFSSTSTNMLFPPNKVAGLVGAADFLGRQG